MPTTRGFVRRLEMGRAGLVSVDLIQQDGSSAIFTIPDLDADPERFNERLSKLALLRDAMNRAEPVELEYTPNSKTGNVIDRVARISRDTLGPATSALSVVVGVVLGYTLHTENTGTATGETPDTAQVNVLTTAPSIEQLVLDMQAPERAVCAEQFTIIREAHSQGLPLRFLVETKQETQVRRILAVGTGTDADRRQQPQVEVNGFVESLGIIPPLLAVSVLGSLAYVRFTTAPAFTGAGNTVGLAPFTPETIEMFVMKNSPAYALFEAGLRDNLRMRVHGVVMGADRGDKDPTGDTTGGTRINGNGNGAKLKDVVEAVLASTEGDATKAYPSWAVTVELLAPIASASRPVWIDIQRDTLLNGPDGGSCSDGVPSSDLSPRSLRDLRLPYPAVWRGLGCFNHGVYRFQLKLPSEFTLTIDGKPLCLHESSEKGVMLAHACLEGDHVVAVEIEEWRCDSEFVMDVYRIR